MALQIRHKDTLVTDLDVCKNAATAVRVWAKWLSGRETALL